MARLSSAFLILGEMTLLGDSNPLSLWLRLGIRGDIIDCFSFFTMVSWETISKFGWLPLLLLSCNDAPSLISLELEFVLDDDDDDEDKL
jgi:hypothetical protein